MTILKCVGCVVAAALLAGCAAASAQVGAVPGIQPFPVILKVEGESGQEVLVSKNSKTQGCDKFPDKDNYRRGCIVAPLNQMVDVKFMLNGSPDWYLTRFQICNAENGVKPSDFGECYLSDEQRADWLVLANTGVEAPNENGYVNIQQYGTGLKTFDLRDFNWTKATYFYRIEVCTDVTAAGGRVEHKCIWMDPGSENNGRGYNVN